MLRFLKAIFLLIISFSVIAAPSQQQIAKRPKIGLALSGGGARGFAHIGVLKALEEHHIPIDYIAGTSMGAIIGGLYALGLSPEELENEVKEILWETVFNQTAQTEYLSLRTNQERRRYFLNLELGVNKEGKLSHPASVVWAEELMLILQRLTQGTLENDFSKFPIPFRAVATDLNQAKAVVLDKGDIALALRASMAIPMVFAPVQWDGKLLVDGGVLNNLPVDVVKAMGADVVIAVNISTPLNQVDAGVSFLQIAKQSIDAALIQNTRKALEDADLIITPQIQEFSFEDFPKSQKIVQKGYAALNQKAIWLSALSLPERDYQQWLLKKRHKQLLNEAPFKPQFIQFIGQQRTHTELLHGQTDFLLEQESVTIVDIERSVRKIMALNDIQQTSYKKVTNKEGQAGLLFEVTEKSWGPHYFRFGFNTTATFDQGPIFQALLKYEWLNINRYGAEWHNEIILGSKLLLSSEFYQPVDFKQRYFVAPYIRFSEEYHPEFEGKHEIARQLLKKRSLGLDFGRNFGTVSELRLGVVDFHGEEELDIGARDIPELTVDDRAIKLSFLYDSLDDPNFARKGTRLSFQSLIYRSYLGEGHHYQTLDFYGRRHFSWGKQGSVITDLRWGAINGKDIPDYESFFFGGINDFAGFREGELEGRYAFITRAGIMTPLFKNPLNINDTLKFLTFVHAGKLWNDPSGSNDVDFRVGGLGAFVWDTPFGAVLLGAGYTDGGEIRYYLSIGNLFEPYP